MRFRKISRFSSGLIVASIAVSSFASEYPQTREERIAEEMGSLAGGEGIVFRPTHAKNEETKASVSTSKKVNKFLWEATRETLKHMPTVTMDKDNGIIITDWYASADHPDYSYKLEVTITDDVIGAASIDVVAHERRLIKGQWINEADSKTLSYKFSDDILRHARNLYIKSGKSK